MRPIPRGLQIENLKISKSDDHPPARGTRNSITTLGTGEGFSPSVEFQHEDDMSSICRLSEAAGVSLSLSLSTLPL